MSDSQDPHDVQTADEQPVPTVPFAGAELSSNQASNQEGLLGGPETGSEHSVLPMMLENDEVDAPWPDLNQGDEHSVLDADASAGSQTPAHSTPNVAGLRVALVGRFGGMNQTQAANVLRSYQMEVLELPRKAFRKIGSRQPQSDATESTPSASSKQSDSQQHVTPNQRPTQEKQAVNAWPDLLDWVVVGADQPLISQQEYLPQEVIEAAGRGEIQLLQEAELWQRLGLVDIDFQIRRYQTPAMLADLLGVSVRVIRRWHRLGLITPAAMLHKLAYYDYAEVATAKRLATWIQSGADARTIERRLSELVDVLPDIQRPLDQLSILIEGKEVLLRHGDGLVETGGQLRFDFDAMLPPSEGEQELLSEMVDQQSVLAFPPPGSPPMLVQQPTIPQDPLMIAAYEAEDDDDLETAIEIYHTILSRDGARADISFQIGELLYRMNHLVAARERYYQAIELDPNFVEARASLGAVLAELGQTHLAVAALRGALSLHEDYVDVHYTLARTLQRSGESEDALQHWKRIVDLAPDSNWAEEAAQYLEMR